MKIKYRYYLKEGDEVKTVNCENGIPEEFAQKDLPRLTLAMLACGFKEDMFVRSRDFLINQSFLIRTPIFTDESGKEHEGQNDEYRFNERGNGYFYGMRPSQSAVVLLDAIKDGFDISTSGGSGFPQNNRFFFDGIEKNPQDFIGKKKPRIFAFSNVSNSTILQDFFDYVHSVPLTLLPGASEKGSIVEAVQQAEQTLEIMKKKPEEIVPLKRRTIAINDEACDLVDGADSSDLEIRSYPINITTVLSPHYNSDFTFTPPEEEYSLMLETIIWHDIGETANIVDVVRKFLQALQVRGQKLPKMIEMGDCTPQEMMYDHDYEYGRVVLGPNHPEKEGQHDRSKAYDVEIKNICDEFEIAFFVGGKTRIGHAKNQVQPSNSICKVKKSDDEFTLEIESSVRSRSVITKEDVDRIATKKGLEKLEIADDLTEIEGFKIDLELEQINDHCEKDVDLAGIKVMNFSLNIKSDLHILKSSDPKCFLTKGGVSVFSGILEPALLSSRLHKDDSPLVIALVGKGSEESLSRAKTMIQAFCSEHEVTKPICLARNFLDLNNDPDLAPLKIGEAAKYGVEIKMAKDSSRVPSGHVGMVSSEIVKDKSSGLSLTS